MSRVGITFKRRVINVVLVTCVVILVGSIALTAYTQYQNSVFCSQFMHGYIQNPPTNIEDYTSKDVLFDESCSPSDAALSIGWIIALVAATGYLLRKRKALASK